MKNPHGTLDPNVVLADYDRWLYRVAHGLAGVDVVRDVADLAQIGRIAMWQALRSWREDRGALPAWLTFKAVNAMRDALRPRQLAAEPLQPWDDAPDPQPFDLEDVLSRVTTLVASREIEQALVELSPAQRRYVRLRFWDNCAGPELTAAFGYDPHSLWSSPVNGARGKLRRRLRHLAPLVAA